MAEAIYDPSGVQEEEFMDYLYFLRIEYERRAREHGANSVKALQTKGLIVGLLNRRGQYAEAMKAGFDLYWRRVKVLGLRHDSTKEARLIIIGLLRENGTALLTRQIYPHALRTFWILVRHVKKLYKKGLYDRALSDGISILEDILLFFRGEDHPVTLNLVSVIAMVYAQQEDYALALRLIEDVYAKRCKLKYKEHEEPDLKGMAATLVKKGYILLRMCRYKEALDCYLGAQQIRTSVYGTYHRKTDVATLGLAEVLYNIGNFWAAKVLLRCVGKFQKRLQRPEILYTYIHNGNLEFARGTYRHALAIFRKAAKGYSRNFFRRRKKAAKGYSCYSSRGGRRGAFLTKAPLEVRAYVFRQIGALWYAMGRFHRASRALHVALKIISKTEFHVEAMIIYRYMALVMLKLKMIANARGVLEALLEMCVETMERTHSVLLAIQRDMGDLFFATRRKAQAQRVFRSLLDSQNSIPERIRHPDTLKVKCQVAKTLASDRLYTDSLALYAEVAQLLAGYFYPQHRDRILVDLERGSVYHAQGYKDKAFALFYKSYEIIAENYGANHRYTKKIIRIMDGMGDRFMSPMIQAALADLPGEVVSLAMSGTDVNVRDLDGCVPLHYAAQGTYRTVVTNLLYRGAIYNAKDRKGRTPEDYTIERKLPDPTKTRFVFMLVERLFECAITNDVSQVRRILQREPSIINARNRQKYTVLQRAVAMHSVDVVKELIDRGANLGLANEEDGTALHMAAKWGYADIMFMILSTLDRTHPKYFTDYIDSRENCHCSTPMHIVAEKGDNVCFLVLAQFNANPLVTDIFGKLPHEVGTPKMGEYIKAYTALYLTGKLGNLLN